ncbi:Diacetyl reductase [(S)-acetoin forming] [Corynebacterium kalinowskii]|uniref:Diacetyl reductase [(S)-acetoin forming] n=1 Tax=Corynebacterium kalinowskii TaxID=2675216 RepID=A0A6B8W0V4_9CORY|nr:SDR family oxidoreductase [Corynebacterium kalinowskii]QGU03250.1 Diacetyl reductase [(S)-acetoin forming] [Corynebacterium kalinowskii]
MKSIFISGAAQGIGRAVAERFLAEGWMVGAYDIAPVEYEHEHLITGLIDVRSPESWSAALADFAAHTGGTIDVVDNNAGIIVAGNIADLSPEQVKRQIDINCTGVVLGAQAAKPYLKRGSQLVNMSSASATYGQPGIATYSASKFFVAGLTEGLSLEWARDGIRVVAIWPLWARTNLANNSAASIKRLGVNITPEEVAETIWKATHPNLLTRGRIHWTVSTADTVLFYARRLAPNRVARQITRLLAG